MIIGFFFVRPVPLPEEELNREDQRNSSYTPLLDYDPHINGQDDDDSEIGVELTPSSRSQNPETSRESLSMALDDILPNVHGKKLWCSSDFWLLFGILSIRTLPAYYSLWSSLTSCLLEVSGTGVMCMSFQKEHSSPSLMTIS
jgi:hypothetical protein